MEVPNPKDNEVLIKIKACGLYAKCVGSVKVTTDTIKEFMPLRTPLLRMSMSEIMNKRYAYIFDFDGVLVNTMNAHFECYRRALEEVNVPIDKEQFYSQAGMTGKEQIEYFARKAGIKVDSENVYARKREIWQSQKPVIDRIDCNLQLLKILKKEGYPVAIASGSSRSSIIPIMQEYKIEVDTVVTGEDVEKGKPSPDLFLCAANRLKVAPEDCIVVEDSDVGIQAAQSAGMKVMRFYDNIRI